MIREDKIYLKHILDSIRFIQKYCKGIEIAGFCDDEILQSAVVRQLEVIGEAARMISNTTKDKLPGIKWIKIVGMRNKLIHEYFGVDLNIVWSTLQEELPKLKKEILTYLKK